MVLGLLVVSVVLSLAYGARFVQSDPKPLAGALVKAGSVAGLAAAGMAGGAAPLIVAGLALGAMGDFALARAGERWFLAGMAAFAAGHLAYAAQFFGVAGWALPGPWVLVALAALWASTEVWLIPHGGALRGAVRAYAAVILTMALAALGAGGGLRLAGVGLFVASDLMLAFALFRPEPKARPRLARALAYAVWPAYWLGQALIALAHLPFSALPH